MNNNFPKYQKLLDEKQLKQVFIKAKKIFSEHLIIFYCKNQFEYPRLGVIVPKKNVAKATQRNCFKRVIREFFRNHKEQLKNLDLIVLMNKKAGELDKSSLYKNLDKKIKKIGYEKSN